MIIMMSSHPVFALAFFILEDIMVLLMIFENYSSLSYKSLAIKVPTAVLSCAATVARCILLACMLVALESYLGTWCL